MIIAAEVKRDEQGYWTHPALVRSGCETSAELSYWLRTHKLQESMKNLGAAIE